MDAYSRRIAQRLSEILRVLSIPLLPLLLACGNDGPGGPSANEGPGKVVSKLQVSPGEVTLTAIGASQQLTVTPLDSNGEPVEGVAITWRSTSHEVVTVDSTGLITAVGSGEAEIIASMTGHQGSSEVSVVQTPSRLAFTAPPTGAVAGSPLAPGITVEIQDANGHAVVGAVDEVAVALLGGPEGAELGGTLTVSASDGVATFEELTIAQAGSGYRFQASAAELTPVESDSFAVLPAEAARLVFTTQPPRKVRPHDPFTVQVDVEDGFGNPIPDWKGQVSLSLENDAGTTTLAGTLQMSTDNGSARFTDLSLDNLGRGYIIRARAPGPTAASSTPMYARLDLASISVSANHSCGIATTGQAYCWGVSQFGELGNGDTETRSVPTPVATDLRFIMISAGFYHTCGVSESGDAYCWGMGREGQLGVGDTLSRYLPASVEGNLKFVSVSAGRTHTCGLTAENKAYCWGNARNGTVGDSTVAGLRLTPTPVAGNHFFASVSAGNEYTCGVTTANKLYCWGVGSSGALGNGSTTSKLVPTQVAGFVGFTSVSAGSRHACGISTNGNAYCWGDGGYGQLGNGDTTSIPVPSPVDPGLRFSSINAGSVHTCAIALDGSAHCWGHGSFGKLGNNSTTSSSEPVPVAGGLTFSSIAAGSSHSCAQAASGEAFCWGLGNGMLGNNSTASSLVPARVYFTEP